MIITRDEAYARLFDLWKAFMVTGISGSIPAPAVACPAYPAADEGNQATVGPRPQRPYCTIKITGLPEPSSGGAYGYTLATHQAVYASTSDFTASFSIFGTGGLNFASMFLGYRPTLAWRLRLKALGLGYLGEALAPQNRSRFLETRSEPMAVFDLRWVARQTVAETVLPVSTVQVTLESKRGSTVLTSELIEIS